MAVGKHANVAGHNLTSNFAMLEENGEVKDPSGLFETYAGRRGICPFLFEYVRLRRHNIMPFNV